ncbi:menaquinone via futalosine step 2 [Halalkalibacter wakoensis JCM 9140]|uniref:Futalosine hydrolase n=1 Tax=Halalkalibacter wakoensis JCM 9140 TaxID=1236970 RepID=W4Q4I8_9BACI|nr:menaquinone via futalosine step 2 [Halalkalibacter wakoensis JCM 9140]
MSETIQATQSKEAKVLIVTSVSAEKEAIEKGLNGASSFDVVVSGVGQAAAASATATALATKTYKYVINAGIAGGFEGRADLGAIVLSNRIVAADLGAESKEGFLSIESLKLGVSSIGADRDTVLNLETAAQKVGLSVSKGTILTLSTVTGTSETADELRTRIPDAIAEGWRDLV